MKIDLHKGTEHVTNAIGKAVEIGKKAADGTKSGAQLLADKAQTESVKAQLKKYNPVFPEQYSASDFGLPNLLVIVDDAVRKDIEVCKGAIGWKSQEKGIEVLHLYDEALEFSGLHFIPAPICDSIYYVDAYDRTRFIRLDCYFEKMQEARLAELQHIAFALGAKRYSVEMYDASNEKRVTKKKGVVKRTKGTGKILGGAEATEEANLVIESKTKRESIASAEFSGERKPTQPKLCWFSHDDNIKNLIHMRCSGNKDDVKKYCIELKGSDFATMAKSTAAKLDAAVGKLGVKSGFHLEDKVVQENSHRMSLQLEF